MHGTDPATLVLLEQARAELADLEGRVAALRSLLDRALDPEAHETQRAPSRFPGERETDRRRIAAARSVASHMSLSGFARGSTEDRLRGTVSRMELREILDEVYGPPTRATAR